MVTIYGGAYVGEQEVSIVAEHEEVEVAISDFLTAYNTLSKEAK